MASTFSALRIAFPDLRVRCCSNVFFPDVQLRETISGYATLVSHGKAARELGYTPQYSWRDCVYLVNTEEHGG